MKKTASLESMVDAGLLVKILDWTSGIDEFERHHAVDGLFHAGGFSVPPFSNDKEGLFLLALDIAFLLWFDDRIDKHSEDRAASLNWERLLNIADRSSARPPLHCSGPEEVFFLRLDNVLAGRSTSEAAYDFWRDTVSRLMRGMYFEQRAGRENVQVGIVETMEHGIETSTIPNIMATAALVYDIDRASRQKDRFFTDFERHFSMYQRLLNDVHSAEKERCESKYAKVTNVVLQMEKHIGSERAASVVFHEISSLQRMIDFDIERIGLHDPFVRIVHQSMKNIEQWYSFKPTRVQC